MVDISFEVAGDRQTALKFDKFPEFARSNLKAEITELTEELDALVKAGVPVKTGKLLEEIQLFIDETQTRVAGKVKVIVPKGDSAEAAKAMALEYGAHDETEVRGYERKLSLVAGKVSLLRKLIGPASMAVKAYTRTPNIQEVAFMRNAVTAIQPQILTRMNAAIARSIAEAEAVT